MAVLPSCGGLANISLSGSNSYILHCFNNIGWMLSGPCDLLALTLSIAFITESSLISK